MRRIARRLLGWALAGILLALALGLANDIDPALDLLSHLRLHLAAGALLCLVVAAVLRLPVHATAAILAAAAALATSLPAVLAGDRPAGEAVAGETVSLLSFNIQGADDDPDAVVAAILGADADIVAMPEFLGSPLIADALAGTYPHIARCPPERWCSLALFSRLPLETPETVESGVAWPPAVAATVRVGGERLTVIGVHAVWPLEPSAQAISLQAVAARIRATEGPLVVAGDFNATPWSLAMRRFLDRSGLAPVSGYRATWPSTLGPLGIPIDHVFAAGGARVAAIRVLPGFTGSDHRPLAATIRLGSGADTDAPASR